MSEKSIPQFNLFLNEVKNHFSEGEVDAEETEQYVRFSYRDGRATHSVVINDKKFFNFHSYTDAITSANWIAQKLKWAKMEYDKSLNS